MHNVDAAIVWNAILPNIANDIDTISIPREYSFFSEVSLAHLKQSPHPKEVKQFMDFVVSNESRCILSNLDYRINKPDKNTF
jgi:ABC-type molybdate transport system substrate-binding protein